mgnify:CR=1 FL=1
MYFSLFLYVLIKTSKQNYAFSNLNTENIWSFSGRFCTDIIKPIQFFDTLPLYLYIKKPIYHRSAFLSNICLSKSKDSQKTFTL